MKQYEEVINTVGPFGRYQKLQFLVLWVISGGTAFYQVGNTLYSASADHYCKVYDNQTYADESSLKNCTIPYLLEGDGISWDKCQRYDVNVSQGISAEVCSSQQNETISCDRGWVYDRTWYENTVVFEYNLVCENDWMKQLSKSIVPLGNFVGCLIFGQLSDMFGRRPIFLTSLVLSVVIAIATSFAPNYPLFVVGQFLLGAIPHALYVTSAVIVTEMVGAKHRTMVGSMIHTGFSVLYMIFGVIGLLCKGNWRHTQLAAGLVWVLFLPSFFVVSETPMWLMRKHKYAKAKRILKRFSKLNKTTLPDDTFDEASEIKVVSVDDDQQTRRYTVLDLFKTRRLCIKTLLMCFNWFSCSFVYYGISLNTDQFGSNPYVTFILAGVVEIPGCLLAWWLMKMIGRRWSLAGFAIIGGIALMLSVPPKIVELTVAIAMVAKLCLTAVFAIVYLYGTEIYPTVVRNAGVGLSSMSARVGSVSSPFVMLLNVYWGPLPFIIMGATSVLAGSLALLLPETRNKQLPETLEDGETFGTKHYQKVDRDETEMDEQPAQSGSAPKAYTELNETE
ncbi:organic cation transporter protein-like [Ptychodera flava]|uniref:organic cation transporter protein-like n=1 Tax=Ptychodera flava TaxID=63121 RepID=UPI00396A0BCC